MSRWEVREWCAEDAPAWLDCQRACFGAEKAKTPADWEFLFAPMDLPSRGIVAALGERIIASYAGLPGRVWFAGEERLCVQPIDLMLRPEFRQGLGGQRLHREVAEAFFERYGTVAGDLCHFGWPIAPAARFGKRLLGYEFVREQLCLTIDALPGTAAPDGSSVEILTEVGEDLRWLWDRCAGEWGLATIRDAAWARWRFLDHPSTSYRLLGVRRKGHLRGLAVLRETPWHWAGAVALCDWLVPSGEADVGLELLHAARQHAAQLGGKRLVALLPEASSAFLTFQEQGWQVETTPYELLVRSFDRRLDADWMRANAWLTLADSDLA